jgi:hypothetical protein
MAHPPSHLSASTSMLLQQACASLDHASSVLGEAASSLSATVLDVYAVPLAMKTRKKPRRKLQSKVSPFFGAPSTTDAAAIHEPRPGKKQKKKSKETVSSQVGPQVSPFFALPSYQVDTGLDIPVAGGPSILCPESSSQIPTPPGLAFDLQPAHFGLIQERICGSLYALVVQAILWNKTRGVAARPILWDLLSKYPIPNALAGADLAQVEEIIRRLGLQQVRARRLVDMANTWVNMPPTPERRYGRRHYPVKNCNPAVKDGEELGPDDRREGWEIGHLPGVGEYALDSFRIFGRDRLRGISENSNVEPEWKRLVPKDKELGPYVKWKWAQEGWDYDVTTGIKRRM